MGGAAGGGKTFGLLLDPTKHINNKNYNAVVFRRTSGDITKPGALWDESMKMYPSFNGTPYLSYPRMWVFPSGARVSFHHLQYEGTVLDWHGAQVPTILWDELQTFTEKQFFYMMTRNRSASGVKTYMKGTCNPDPDSFLAKFLSWWVGEDGYAILERSGKTRFFVRYNDELIWSDSPGELEADYPGTEAKSVMFILSTIYDNKILMQNDPSYLSNLLAQDRVTVARLLGDKERGGNWKVRSEAGKVFDKSWFEIVDAIPPNGRKVRGWDLAATLAKMKGNDPDFTAGVKWAMVGDNFYITDCLSFRKDPSETDIIIKNTASQDGVDCSIAFEQEPGAGGKRDMHSLVKMLKGYTVSSKPARELGDKVVKASRWASQAKIGNVKLLSGDWNEGFLVECHNFPDVVHDDRVDAASIGFDLLTGKPKQKFTAY